MSVQYKDYYATLGVAKGATHDEIRKAFRKLARQHHPDVSKEKDKKNAEAKFKEINEAYEVLGDEEKRKRYDELGADWDQGAPQPPPGWGRGGGGHHHGGGFPDGGSFSGTGFSDFFEQFFGGAAARGGGPGFSGFTGHQPPARGSDIEADLLVTIEEALHGAKKKISFRRDGRSEVETYEVRIPKGVREGQKIRLAGQGESVGKRGQAGDLYLAVRFEKHPDYTIDGSDLIYDLELPVWQAVLGDIVSVPTPDGPVRLKIPDCSQPERKFRIKGRGLPTGPTTRGDFYVRLVVLLPNDLTPEQRTLWEKLARL
ncbi:MAG: DnaJ C-terminal domain-containing protein [Chthoniobacter sp.]|nr:DnaJ C-terminal domain-containing protein [Chthoniobacter sp.]